MRYICVLLKKKKGCNENTGWDNVHLSVQKPPMNVLLNNLSEELESYLVVSFQYFVFFLFREWEASNDFLRSQELHQRNSR